VSERVSEEKRIEEKAVKMLKEVRVPFSLKVVIIDDKSGKVLFEWRRGKGNLSRGMQKTIEFVEKKIGIPVRDLLK